MNIQKLKYWLLVILWTSFVFWMSARMFSAESISSVLVTIIRFTVHSFSAEQVHFTQWLIPKLGHVGEYFILGILLFRAFFAQTIKIQNWECSYYSTIAVILYACIDELHQSVVYTRNTSLPDILIDTLGGLLAIGTCVLWHRYKNQMISLDRRGQSGHEDLMKD